MSLRLRMLATDNQLLPINEISTDGGTQSRAGINDGVVLEYANSMLDGTKFPPIVVYYDGQSYWLADGFHRIHAAKQGGFSHLPCDIKQGTRRDAILFSVGANHGHGLRRTNADKRRAVETLLTDEEWGGWTDNDIAKKCGVSQPFVSQVRKDPSLITVISEESRSYITKHGTESRMNVARIGNSRSASDEETLQREPYEPFISAKSDEHYTPPEIIAAVVDCLGEIHLDPCSNSHLNPNVPAINHLVLEDDGLSCAWKAPTLFLNPPYSEVNLWLQKLVKELDTGSTEEAIALTKADPSTQWFQLLWSNAAMLCFAHKRLAFLGNNNEGNSATFPSCLAYFGANPEKFYHAFSGKIGVCVQVVEPEFHLEK